MIKAGKNISEKSYRLNSLVKEGKLLRRLKDAKNVVNPVECIHEGNQSFLVMEHMNRGDLASYMIEHNIPFLTEAEMRSVTKQILIALDALHANSIVHNAI